MPSHFDLRFRQAMQAVLTHRRFVEAALSLSLFLFLPLDTVCAGTSAFSAGSGTGDDCNGGGSGFTSGSIVGSNIECRTLYSGTLLQPCI